MLNRKSGALFNKGRENKSLYNKDKAFSMVETMFVVILIGILSAAAIGYFSTSKNVSSDSAARTTLLNVSTQLSSLASQDDSYAAYNTAALANAAIHGYTFVSGASDKLAGSQARSISISAGVISTDLLLAVKGGPNNCFGMALQVGDNPEFYAQSGIASCTASTLPALSDTHWSYNQQTKALP